ncbi:carbohydrate ABC transporter permease [Cohnella silvisoli]|uniref:Carbohydrate ABC transporter permease n=1 Tax=Cohnella silvisoli TaxID=2873699 RepID=A0ABV1KYN0_9BACL|nr:carbohydrate ABC transporter permease [Cohnella silvisoli]MCD9024192.1 carbohydrate ABC transporter permease [Cohnella silvisoli]
MQTTTLKMQSAPRTRVKPMRNWSRLPLYVCLTILAFVFIYPLIYTILASFKTNSEIFSNYFGLPSTWHFENYASAWVKGKIGNYFLNSLFICTVFVVAGLFFSSMGAYVIARVKAKWLVSVFYFFVAGMMIPVHSILIPLAQMAVSFKLSDNYSFLIGLYVAGGIPYMIFVMTGFMRSLPTELEEAVIIDGGGLWTIYRKVLLPLSRPVLATMGILGFLSTWNDLILALLFIKKSSMWTLSLGLMNFTGLFTTDYAGLCAAIILVNIPIIIVYLFLQEYVEKGLTSGAVKG